MKKQLLYSMQWVLFLSIIIQPIVIWGQAACNITIKGKILNIHTQEPVAFASIAIKDQNIGTLADEEGNYILTNLCEGTYIIVCSHIACDHNEHEVIVERSMERNFQMEEHSLLLEEIVVKEKILELKSTAASNQLSAEEMGASRGLSLADALEQLPGVSTLKTGASIAKPVIQGLHSNRVLLLNNGVRQEAQQWGSEHAPAVDPFLSNQLKVIKGANSVRYGAGAIGGVILLEPLPLPEKEGIGGELNLQALSNGQTGIASGMIAGKLKGRLPISGRLQATLKRGGNLHAPTYFLDNTGLREINYSWALGMKKEKWETELFYSRFSSRIGIFSGAHIGNLTDLLNAIEREEPLDKGNFSYDLGRPQQRISHELFKWSTTFKTGDIGRLDIQLARQFNRRQEFDAHRSFGSLPTDFNTPDIEFEITTHTAEVNWEHRPIAHLRGMIGGHFMHQTNTTDRGALIPNYDNNTAGLYWIERWKKAGSPIEIEGGLRYDYQWAEVGQQGGDTINDQLTFDNFSGTLGAIYQFPKWITLRFNLGSAWRAPNMNELYSDGVHHGAASYELGDASLIAEQAYHAGFLLEVDNQNNLKGNVNVYYKLIDDFIFLEPQSEPVLTIRGAFPAFYYTQSDAQMMGMDWQFSYRFLPAWQLESSGAILRAKNLSRDEHLSLMPADQFEHALRYTFGKHTTNNPFVRLAMINVLEQSRVPKGLDYAPPPPGHTRFKIEGGFPFTIGKQSLQLSLAVFNLTNVRYREYLNRFRYFSDEIGRNFSVHLKVPFGQ